MRTDYTYLLCPGEQRRKLFNVPQLFAWYKRPLENTKYCDTLDDVNKISLDHNYISPFFENRWEREIGELNPHSIKICAEGFLQMHIRRAIRCNMPCGKEIVAIYEKAAKDGITEAYNNLAILQLNADDFNESSEQKAIDYFKLASDGGSDYADLNLASLYMEKNNIKEAKFYYKSAAERGNVFALFNLALIFNFGLYEENIDLELAEKYYCKCIKSLNNKDSFEWGEKEVLNSSLLNLILLMDSNKTDYQKIVDLYNGILYPSDELEYCHEILQIKHDNSFTKYIQKIITTDNQGKPEMSYQKYNRAIFLYYGLAAKSFNVNVKRNKHKALAIIKSLSKEDTTWVEKDTYISNFFSLTSNNYIQKIKQKLLVVFKQNIK